MRRSPLALLLLLIVAIHAPFVGGGWMTDDFMHIDYLQRQHLSRVFVSPDVFGYFRPIPQATLFANLWLTGATPSAFRLVNLLLHLAVICAAFGLARLLLGDGVGAFLATVAFALTPKAHTIAILWVSGRPELLMSFFALVAAICWIRWERGDGSRWMAGTIVSYLLAVLSKEPAILLPAILVLMPPGPWRLRRLVAAAGLVLSATAAVALRLLAGARIPFPDAYYNVAAPPGQDLQNAWNYLTRAVPSPAVVWVFSVLVGRQGWRSLGRFDKRTASFALFAAVWFFVLMLPVLPLEGRSELYLYLPGFGLCVLCGALAERALEGASMSVVGAAVALSIVVLGSFQISRGLTMHEAFAFSSKLERALRDHDEVRHYSGVLTIVPKDAVAERALRDSVSGYLDVALKVMFGRRDIGGTVIYPGEPEIPSGLRLVCAYQNGQIALTH